MGVPIEYSASLFLRFILLWCSHPAHHLSWPRGRCVCVYDSVIYHIDQICDLAVIRAWSLKYHGDAHKVLLKAIDDLHARPIRCNYAKIIPIAQSSGTGKSKTVDKVATMRILFPICLREDIGNDYFGVWQRILDSRRKINHICFSISSYWQSSPRSPSSCAKHKEWSSMQTTLQIIPIRPFRISVSSSPGAFSWK